MSIINIDAYVDYLMQWLGYSVQCFVLPINTAGCGQFWMALLFVAEFVLFLFCIFIIRHIWREKREWKSYQQRLIDRAKIADAETMLKVQWKSGDFFEDISESQLAEKMRQEIAQVKNG